MVQVDLPAAFAVGHIYALLAKGYLKKEKQLFTNRLLGPLNLLLACGFAPGGMFLLIGWPAWEVMYISNWVEDPYNKPLVAAFYVLFGIIMVLIGNLGFILAHRWYQAGKDTWVIYGSIAAVFLTVLPFLIKWGIWMKVGTYADINGPGGYSFWQAPFFHGWLGIMGYLFATIVLAGLWFKLRGSRMQP